MNSLLIILITTPDTSKLIGCIRWGGRAVTPGQYSVCKLQYLYAKLSGAFVLS